MSIELIKSIELVPKRNAFKARSYNNAGLKTWVDLEEFERILVMLLE